MSTASVKTPEPSLSPAALIQMTIEACRLAKEAAGAAAEGIATASVPLLNSLRQREKALDMLDMEIDEGVTLVITRATAIETRTSCLHENHDRR
jgi:hypothetical protein